MTSTQQIFINEETIRNQENDESMLKTLFYMRTITKIEVTSSMVKMWLKSNDAPSKVYLSFNLAHTSLKDSTPSGIVTSTTLRIL
jgi:hypothetical protein